MVSSIVPGAAGASTLGLDPRYVRAREQGTPQAGQQAGDSVQVSSAAGWAAANQSVASGLAQLQTALGVGRDAQTLLLKVQALAADPASTQADLDGALGDYQAGFAAASAGGASLISGRSIAVQAEPGAAPLTVDGADLALSENPSADATLTLSAKATLADRGALTQAVQTSLERLQSVMERLGDSSRSLAAHQSFLGAAQGAAGGDLNADTARLLALQVRQGLQGVGGGIANVEPQAVLALFKV